MNQPSNQYQVPTLQQQLQLTLHPQAQQQPLATQRQPTPMTVLRILVVILMNGWAVATNRPRPYTVTGLNILRAQLLQDPFFDPEHRREELAPRIRPAAIRFNDLVVLMAKLMRVMTRQRPFTDEELAERIMVRNACLDQPFFDRARVKSTRPFVDDGVEDEACFP